MFKKYSALLLILLLPLQLLAWGVVGHRAIGTIAEHHLSAKARREVAQLLGHETLALVSTFPDEIRSRPEFRYTSPWHYTEFEHLSGLAYAPYAKAVQALTEPNAYSALQQMMQQVKDPTKAKEDRAFALKFIVHLVGDIHQPMHASHAEDKGGNDIKVKFQGKDTNLHGLWDSGLIEYQGLTYLELARAYDHASSAQIRQWQHDAPITWLFESYQLSAPLYQEAAAQNNTFDFRYYPAHATLVEQRVLQAGIRLAGLLNELLG
ncbi:S1/P1 nuclease [Hymenobacter cavernae]|uniref:Endonuclease n=1 Tax=Hymenobacter cavernae TaxID=2044852 RepID=A0ABQ1U9N1_9BACT|nr:S1/P1 nuclease [Hymenobacter cavernae]GGF12533.1 endonuclease [Hymenobacter cavernae]